MWRSAGRFCMAPVQYSILCHRPELGLLAMVEMAIFLVILIVGLAYVWVKSDLDWVKRKVKYASGRYERIQLKENA